MKLRFPALSNNVGPELTCESGRQRIDVWLSLAHIFRSLDGLDVDSRKEQERRKTGTVERLRGEGTHEFSASRSCDSAATPSIRVQIDRQEVRSTVRFVMTRSPSSELQQSATGIPQKSSRWTRQCCMVLMSAWIFAAPWVAASTARA